MRITLLKVLFIIQLIVIISFVIFYHNHILTEERARDALPSNFSLLSFRVNTGTLSSPNLLIFNFKPLQQKINNYIESNDLNASVFVLNIRDGAYLGIRAADEVEPASLNKLPIAIEIMRKVERGDLTLNQTIPIKKSEINDKSGDLYQKNLSSLTVDKLMYYMLSESDNTATLALLDQIDLEDLEELSLYLDYYTEPIDVSDPENNSLTITPRSTSHLFVSLYLSTILEPANSQYILSLLTNTSFDIYKYARLPKDVIVAQKYGSYHNGKVDFFHSCGILYIKDSRIFYCVMTRGLDREKASEVVGDIVYDIYDYIVKTREKLESDHL